MSRRSAAIYIGSFQPFHDDHRETLAIALNNYDDVIVVLGSADLETRTPKNPWLPIEREEMIRRSFATFSEVRTKAKDALLNSF